MLVTMPYVDDANADGIDDDVYVIFISFVVTVLPQTLETFQSVTDRVYKLPDSVSYSVS